MAKSRPQWILLLVLALLLEGVPRLASLYGGVPSWEGRWLFRAMTEHGHRIPLFILSLTQESGRLVGVILSKAAPVELDIHAIRAVEDSLVLDLQAGEETFRLQGRLEKGFIKGTGRGGSFEGKVFVAEPTEWEALPTPREPSYEEYNAFRFALRLPSPRQRLERLQEFVRRYPPGPLQEEALLRIVEAMSQLETPEASLQAAVERALQASSDPFRARADVARMLADAGRLLDEAGEYARQAVEAAGNNTAVEALFRGALGSVLWRQGRLEEAARELERAHSILPSSGRIAFDLAEVRSVQSRHQEAYALWADAYVAGRMPEALSRLESAYRKEQGSLEGLHSLIDEAYARRPPLFDPGKYQGEIGGRTVVAELFTGSECGPCQASDYAFDALLDHFPQTLVTVLTYHLHVPMPDPITNPDSEARARFYQVRSTPFALFGGKNVQTGGGTTQQAPLLFDVYRRTVESLLGKPSLFQLDVSGRLQEGRLEVRARVLPQESLPGPYRLFLALVEDTVHYTGRNGIHLHHKVVRKLLGGAEGIRPAPGQEYLFSHSLREIEEELRDYLLHFQEEYDYRFNELPYRLDAEGLSVVAFLQDVESREIVDAVTVRVPSTGP